MKQQTRLFRLAALAGLFSLACGGLAIWSNKHSVNDVLSDLALSNIEALADNETGRMANRCCAIWNIEYSPSLPFPSVKCMTGGAYKCEDCACPW